MIKNIIKVFYSIFILIVLAMIFLSGWTAYSFISQPEKSDKVLRIIKDMYVSQKSVVLDLVDLTGLLINEKDLSENNGNFNLSNENDLLTIVEDNSQLIELPVVEDNFPGIGIEPSLNEFGEEILPEHIEEPLVNEEKESSMNKMLSGMDINP